MPRLFTGLEVPPEIAEALASKRGALPGSRWMEASDYHVTLRFFGDVEAQVAKALYDGLAAAKPRAPFTVTLDRLACFGGDRPRALVAAVAATSELADVQAEHEQIAQRAEAPPIPRRFWPHVTLARLKRASKAADVAAYLGEAGLFTPLAFRVERIALFSARDSTGGGPYVVEAAYPLG